MMEPLATRAHHAGMGLKEKVGPSWQGRECFPVQVMLEPKPEE